MSYNVLIIAEDFTKDEFILKPLVEKMLAEKGKPNAKVQVCRNPNPGGVESCLDSGWLLENILPLYPMVDLFLLFVDRDGKANRNGQITSIEQQMANQLRQGAVFLGENAWQEVEVFILAGHALPDDWSWQDIRGDPDVKNTFFRQFAQLKETTHLPHEGRKKLMKESIKSWQRIKNRCPDDVVRILNRL